MLPKFKNILIFGIIAIIIILSYVFFVSNNKDQAPLVSSNPSLPVTTSTNTDIKNVDLTAQADDELSQSFLSLLLGVQSINLNDSIFKEGSAFYSLSDSSILLTPDGTEGRPNPFAPLGSDTSIVAPSPVVAPTAGAGVKPN